MYNRAGEKKRQIIVPTPNRLLANLQRSLRQQLANLKPRWENALNGHVNNKGRNGTESLADRAQRPRGFGAVPGLNPAPPGEMRWEMGQDGDGTAGFLSSTCNDARGHGTWDVGRAALGAVGLPGPAVTATRTLGVLGTVIIRMFLWGDPFLHPSLCLTNTQTAFGCAFLPRDWGYRPETSDVTQRNG